MSEKQLILIQLPPSLSKQQLTKISTFKQLEIVCHRFGHTTQNNLKQRIFVYEEKDNTWNLTPKIKRIYKYIKRNNIPKNKGQKSEIKVKSLKSQPSV